MNEIDEKFDKAEKIVDRTKALLVKIVGAIAAVAVAAWALMAEFGDNEAYDEAYDEGMEQYEPDAQYNYEGDEYFMGVEPIDSTSELLGTEADLP